MLTATLFVAFAVVLAGSIRALVGAGRYVSRGWGYPLAASVATYAGPGLVWSAIPLFLAAAATHWVGIRDWTDKEYMATHLGWPASAASVLYTLIAFVSGGDLFSAVRAAAWAVCCIAVGAFYEDMLRWLEPRLQPVRAVAGVAIDANRVAEFIAGAVVIGGVALI